jgi:chorismate mutase
MRRMTLFALLVLALPACRPATLPPPSRQTASGESLDRLLGLIRDRLGVMHDVARWKWARKAAIEDPEREASLLKEVAEKGTALDLDPELTRAFFRGQIEAAKIIQRADFSRWEADGRSPDGESPDLAGVLRPRIDGLNRDLLAALAEARGQQKATSAQVRARARELLGGEGINAEAREAAIRPLLAAIE